MNGSESKVRRAVTGDEPILRELRLQALNDSPAAFGSTYERELARTTADWQRWLSPGVTLVWSDAHEAQGMVAGMRDADDATVAHLMAMWVHPSVRGSGAADALVAALVEWAAAERFTLLRLNVMHDNLRALRFYQRRNFKLTGKQTVHQRAGQFELQMDLPIHMAYPSSSSEE
jgi:ribosomal protein S18 acetylase RimI-like enzyme